MLNRFFVMTKKEISLIVWYKRWPRRLFGSRSLDLGFSSLGNRVDVRQRLPIHAVHEKRIARGSKFVVSSAKLDLRALFVKSEKGEANKGGGGCHVRNKATYG